ncbi:5'-nucleotidase C-terminal domain-containing protein [Metabacillus sp. GX 13764]|uniref:5'-nucleotidase C-terminal domain-containing protein n=1 Tax=Metabacillus kandeliae TaxID=2900151 RepID=UPI001E31C444|nr:5'-nucleotidase C-terminal domain-containing protein [Metabacillus kandeliae]MCD7035190.1 5'-nucleotidase C-terminal domain-containing protein [Metabacillus kandeliae]
MNFSNQASAETAVKTVAEAIANNSGTAAVEGYVVAHTKGTKSYNFQAPFGDDYNFALADSPTEKDSAKLLPVQIPSSFRSQFGLKTNPALIGQKVRVTGSLEAYFTVPGLKSPTAIEKLGTSTDPGQDPGGSTGNVKISDAKKKIGQEATVTGIVTADNTAIGGGKLSTYIQDETGGINVFALDASKYPELKEGQEIKVKGTIKEYKKLTEIEPAAGGIEVVNQSKPLPAAKEFTIKDLQDAAKAEPVEGQLVKVKGYVQSVPETAAGGGYNVSILDSEYNSTTLRVMEGTNAIKSIQQGKWYEFTAIASQYDSYQLLPRKAEDMKLLDPQPEAPQTKGEYTAKVESIVDGDTIHLQTPVLGTDKVRYVNIDTPETYHTPKNEADQNQKDYGEKAKAYLNEILRSGDDVIVKVGEEAKDDYGRLLAQVIRKKDNLNTNLEMVKKGYAATYFIWPVGDMKDYEMFQAAVKEAKDQHLGIWDEKNPLMELPFAFRAREQGKGFTRYVGNSDTKKYVEPEKWGDVPVEKRIFFASTNEAEANGYTKAGDEPAPEEGKVSLQLLGMNDLHGKIDQSYALDINGDGKNDGTYGRMDYTAAYLKQRAADNPNTLIVHDGDMIGGSSPVSALFQDEPTVEMMENIGFDVGVVGNHEFDEGTDELKRILNGGEHPEGKGTKGYDGQNFPELCANCKYKSDGSDFLPPYAIKDVDGVKVGFIGVVTKSTAGIVMPEGIKDITFTDETEAVNKAAKELEAQGVKSIIVLAHMDAEQKGDVITGDAANMAKNVDDEVDVIFAGHNHMVDNGTVDNKLIVQASEYGKAISDVDLEIDRKTGDITKKNGEIVWVDQSKIQPDPEVGAILKKYQDLSAGKINEVEGEAAAEIKGGYGVKGPIGDNGLGNLIADGMKYYMKSDFALMNGGGIRDVLNAGPVTWGELFNIQPFGNTLVKLEIKGADLYTIMNAQLSAQYGPDYSIGGFTYTWDPATTKVKDIYLPNGEEIDSNATYTVTVNNFMATATSGKYQPIGELGKNPVQGPEDLTATVAYVKSLKSPFNYKAEGRISDDIAAPVTTAELSKPDLANGHYSKEAVLTLSAQDTGTGVDKIQYKLGSGEWMTYTEPVKLTQAGEQNVSYRAIDKVHNAEEAKTITAVIEAEAEKITFKELVTLVANARAKASVKANILAQLAKAELNFVLADKIPSYRSLFQKRGLDELTDLAMRIPRYKDKDIVQEDREAIVKAINQLIEQEKAEKKSNTKAS